MGKSLKLELSNHRESETSEDDRKNPTKDSSRQLKLKSLTKISDSTTSIGIGILILTIFLLDLNIKTGVAIGILYVVPILLTPWLSYLYAPFLVAGICTIPAIAGVILSPGIDVTQSDGTTAWNSIINRTISLFMVWAAALLTYQYRCKTETQLRLASMVESSHDAIIGQTLQGEVTSWNKVAEEVFGYSEQESLGQLMTFLFPPDLLSEENNILDKLQQGQRISNFETIRRRKDGKDIYVSLTISPIIDRWGNLIGGSKIVRDISQQNKMENMLAIQNLTMIQYTDALKQSNEDLSQFAYIASHDLQEPLRTIHGFTQLLAERYQNQLDEQAKEYIGFVTDGASRLQILIQDLLKYSRVQSQEVKYFPVNTNNVLTIILQQLQTIIEEKHVRITHTSLPTISTDEELFQRLLQNLVTNALKFHGPDSLHIHISSQEDADEWVFMVKDNGIGIEPDFFERIFLPFKRLHTREEYQGTGIGLAICRKIVERQGGRIWVESEVGKGSTFIFSIPKHYQEKQ